VSESTFLHTMVYTIPSAVGAFLFLILLFVLVKRPSRLLLFFLCFYLISIAHLAGGLITPFLLKSRQSLGVHQFWTISLAVSRLRYVFLILFVHSAHRFRAAPVLAILMIAIVGLGIISPFVFYSVIPNLVDIVVVLYAFSYWLAVYLMRNTLSISFRRQGLLRAVLICSGFFLTGVILDLLEDIPQVSIYVSILLFDFYPIYLVGIGGVMAFWALRDLFRPSISRDSLTPRDPDLSGLQVSRREREVIGLILEGETNASIADRLFISESTVKKHINNLFRKLGIASRWELLKLTQKIHPKE
jgi:DNA-binding CsgD family transcriptional regulator